VISLVLDPEQLDVSKRRRSSGSMKTETRPRTLLSTARAACAKII